MEEKKKMNGCLKWALIGFAAFILLGIIGNMLDDGSNDNKKEKKVETTDSVSAIDSIEKKQQPKQEEIEEDDDDLVTWNIQTKIDEMTDTKNIWASISSDNYIEQDFPYEGKTHATITVRYMKKYGYDILLGIEKGQIIGHDINGTNYVTARFDNGTPKKYRFNDAADGSSDYVFLRNAKDFMEECKKAKEIKVDIPIYQAGKPVFIFHVDKPLEWPKQ